MAKQKFRETPWICFEFRTGSTLFGDSFWVTDFSRSLQVACPCWTRCMSDGAPLASFSHDLVKPAPKIGLKNQPCVLVEFQQKWFQRKSLKVNFSVHLDMFCCRSVAMPPDIWMSPTCVVLRDKKTKFWTLGLTGFHVQWPILGSRTIQNQAEETLPCCQLLPIVAMFPFLLGDVGTNFGMLMWRRVHARQPPTSTPASD